MKPFLVPKTDMLSGSHNFDRVHAEEVDGECCAHPAIEIKGGKNGEFVSCDVEKTKTGRVKKYPEVSDSGNDPYHNACMIH